MRLTPLWGSLLAGLLLVSVNPSCADMLVFSGATYRSLGCCATMVMPDRRTFNAWELFPLDALDVNAEDAVLYELDSRAFHIYRDITPYDLLQSHPYFTFYDLATDLALQTEQSPFFALAPSPEEINANHAILYIGRLRVGEALNIGSAYLRPRGFWLLMLPAIIGR